MNAIAAPAISGLTWPRAASSTALRRPLFPAGPLGPALLGRRFL